LKMQQIQSKHVLYLSFCLALLLNIVFWAYAKDERAVWENVPPVPTKETAMSLSLGDGQFFYRVAGIVLQNLGDTGGRTTRLTEYDYPMLGKWFFLVDSLDPVSDFFPLLAAFYYGATRNAKDLDPVVDYLTKVGRRPEGEKWRWLAQAVYLARYEQQDMEKALKLAYLLANHPNNDRPGWTYQMPAFVLNAKGDKEAAYQILMNLLIDEAENLHPNEVNFTKEYICDRLLSPAQKEAHPLCTTH